MFDRIADDPTAQQTLAEIKAGADFDAVAIAREAGNIFQNAVAQPLICAYQTAAWAAVAPLLPKPALFAGYSVGELAAYGCAGALSAVAVVQLAQTRARAMDDATATPSGLMAVRGLPVSRVEELCAASGAQIAIINAGDHFIVGGTTAALQRVESNALASGAVVHRLNISVAAHTRSLAPASTRFRSALEASTIAAPTVPVLAGISGGAVQDRAGAITALSRQLSTPLQWSACLDAAYERGCRMFLELGPGDALARMARERFPELPARGIADFRALAGVAEWVAKHR